MNKLKFSGSLAVLLALHLAVGYNCSREKATCVSYIADSFEVYAPDQKSLDEAVVKVEFAHKQISKILGETPPAIAVLLFSSNEDLLKFDYAEFIKRKIHFLPWLTPAGLKHLAGSPNHAATGVSVIIHLQIKNYDDLGIILANSEDAKNETILVQGVDEDKNIARFKKGDVIVQVNGHTVSRLSQFDSLYSATHESQTLVFKLRRSAKPMQIMLQKPGSAADFFPAAEIDLLSIPISHEAGHIFFLAFVDTKLGEYCVLDPAIQNTPLLRYGHPLMPDWLDEAMAIFCETDEMIAARIKGLQNNPQDIVDLELFCHLVHPTLRTERENLFFTKREFARFYSQSIAFAKYLFDKEGPNFINALILDLAAAGKFEEILAKAQTIPHNFAELNQDFVKWLVIGTIGVGPN
jgi:hypothetical protein